MVRTTSCDPGPRVRTIGPGWSGTGWPSSSTRCRPRAVRNLEGGGARGGLDAHAVGAGRPGGSTEVVPRGLGPGGTGRRGRSLRRSRSRCSRRGAAPTPQAADAGRARPRTAAAKPIAAVGTLPIALGVYRLRATSSANAFSRLQTPFAVDPIAFAVDPIAFAVDPIAFAVDPIAFAVDPIAFAVDPIACAVDPIACAVDPIAFADDPIPSAVDPIASAVDLIAFAVDPTLRRRSHRLRRRSHRSAV